MTNNSVVLETNVPNLKLRARGKVRDIYDDGDRLLFIATDRISAFDYILATGIPEKGRVLTQMTLFWLDFLRDVIPNHFLSTDMSGLPPELEGRSMWVKRAEMFDIECVARGYISGSGWKDYQRTGAVCGIPLPKGLKESDQLPEPIFTPATKAQTGHDENISFDQAAEIIGADLAGKLRDLTLGIYKKAADYARARGIIIADTKFEFGMIDGQIILCDEVLTPDSSRFWPLETYSPGGAQPSYDKQFVRDYLESIHWNKQPPAPALPEDVARRTSEKYKEAYRDIDRARSLIVNLLDILLVIVVGVRSSPDSWPDSLGWESDSSRRSAAFCSGSGSIGFRRSGFTNTSRGSRSPLSNLLGFFAVFFGFVMLGALIGKLLSKLFRWTGLSWLDRLLGGAFGFVRGGLIAVAFVAVLLAFASKPLPNWMVDSKILPYAIDASDVCAALAPAAVKDAFRESMRDIQKIWDENLKKKKRKPDLKDADS